LVLVILAVAGTAFIVLPSSLDRRVGNVPIVFHGEVVDQTG
jgi:hypothetical protein